MQYQINISDNYLIKVNHTNVGHTDDMTGSLINQTKKKKEKADKDK